MSCSEFSNESVLHPLLKLASDVRPSGVAKSEESLALLSNTAKLLALPRPAEIAEVQLLSNQLSHDSRTYSLLMQVLERVATSRTSPVRNAEEDAEISLLVAIPLLFPENDYIKLIANSTDEMVPIADAIKASGRIDPEAQFQLIPRLFEYSELMQLSYGAVFKMGDQLHQAIRRQEPVQVDPSVYEPDAQAPVRRLPGQVPKLVVRYLVGMVSSTESREEQLFPLENYTTEQFDAFVQDDVTHQRICHAVDHAFDSMTGCIEAGLPDDFFSALRQSSELVREVGLTQFIESNDNIETESIYFGLIYVRNADLHRDGALLLKLDAESHALLDTLPWERVGAESMSSCTSSLVGALASYGIEAQCLELAALPERPELSLPNRAEIQLLLDDRQFLSTNLKFIEIF